MTRPDLDACTPAGPPLTHAERVQRRARFLRDVIPAAENRDYVPAGNDRRPERWRPRTSIPRID